MTAQLVTAKLQWGKDDIAYNLHVAPLAHTRVGIQRGDFLIELGFERSRCQFVTGLQCYAHWIPQGFNQESFWQAFERAYSALVIAQQYLEECGLPLASPKVRGLRSNTTPPSAAGDGHTAPKSELIRKAEDEQFHFAFSLLETPTTKGWVTHYRPKHLPLSPELEVSLRFLGLSPFSSCPQFDFEACYWRFVPFRKLGAIFVTADGGATSNAVFAQKNFDAHARRFSHGIEALLAANSFVEPFGMGFLEMTQSAQQRADSEITRRISHPKQRSAGTRYEFDVAISFAGTERTYAERLATQVKNEGFSVFYDEFYPEMLWGKNLVELFDEIYRKRSARCVMFVSEEYEKRMWTIQERRSAQARALEERGQEYILPIKVGNVELPGMPPTMGYLEREKYGIEQIADLLIAKLRALHG